MLSITVKSYDEHFDTFHCSFIDSLNDTVFDSLLPAAIIPYIAPETCDGLEDLPYDLVGCIFHLQPR